MTPLVRPPKAIHGHMKVAPSEIEAERQYRMGNIQRAKHIVEEIAGFRKPHLITGGTPHHERLGGGTE